MLKILVPSLIACACSISSALAACNYPLDAIREDYDDLATFPFVKNIAQTVTAQIQASPSFEINYTALSHQVAQDTLASKGPFGDIAIPSTGIVVLEMTQSIPAPTPTAPGAIWSYPQVLLDLGTQNPKGFENYILVTFTIINGGMAPQPRPQLIVSAQGTGERFATTVQKIPLTLPLSNYRFGLYLNQDRKKIGVAVNGTDYGYFSHTLFTRHISKIAVKLGLSEGKIQATDPIVGKTIDFSLITDASLMSHIYPKGTMDMCGTVI